MDWDELRYGRLLPASAASLRRGAVYAAVVAAVEWRREPWRRDVACRRIARWLRVPPVRAARIYRACLRSEAREEADCAFFMRHPAALDEVCAAPVGLPMPERATIYSTLHLGSPVLGYLWLCRRVAPGLALVARAIDPANPMPEAKRRFAVGKVAWTEARAGRPFFATDAASMLRVRAWLRAGHPLYALADVPGDAVGRSADCTLYGEAVRLAAGLPTLARIAGSPVQTLAVTRDREGFAVRVGPRVEPGTVDVQQVLDALAPFIAAHPEQWWMWPYLPPAIDRAEP